MVEQLFCFIRNPLKTSHYARFTSFFCNLLLFVIYEGSFVKYQDSNVGCESFNESWIMKIHLQTLFSIIKVFMNFVLIS